MAVGLSVRPWKPKSAVSAREEAACSPAGLPSTFTLWPLHSSLSASVWASETDPPYFTYPSAAVRVKGENQLFTGSLIHQTSPVIASSLFWMHINGQFGGKVDLLADVELKSRFVSAHLFPQPDSGFSR